MDLSALILYPTLGMYLLAGVLLFREFFHANTAAPSSQGVLPLLGAIKTPMLLLGLACAGHAILLFNAAQLQSSLNTAQEKLSITFVAALLAWLITISMLIANRYIKNALFLPVVSMLSALFIALYAWVPASTHISVDMNLGLVSHITLSLFAFGVLSLSCLYAMQLAYINYQLKHKKMSLLSSHMPPLMSVERILYKLLYAGCVLLAISLITGFMFVPNMLSDGYAHKTLLSCLAFAVYLLALTLHHFYGLKARTIVSLNFIGVALLTLAYFGSRFVKEILL